MRRHSQSPQTSYMIRRWRENDLLYARGGVMNEYQKILLRDQHKSLNRTSYVWIYGSFCMAAIFIHARSGQTGSNMVQLGPTNTTSTGQLRVEQADDLAHLAGRIRRILHGRPSRAVQQVMKPLFSGVCLTAWWLGHPSEKYESQLG